MGAVCNVNGIVSSFFASNFVGIEAMSAVGLYSPINMLITAISLMLVGGSSILCGKAFGKNEQDTMHKVFSLDLVLAFLTGALFAALFITGGMFDLTGFFTRDEAVRLIFNRYLLGQSIGVIPLLLGNQLPAFLTMENRGKRTITATVAYTGTECADNKNLRKKKALLYFADVLPYYRFTEL